MPVAVPLFAEFQRLLDALHDKMSYADEALVKLAFVVAAFAAVIWAVDWFISFLKNYRAGYQYVRDVTAEYRRRWRPPTERILLLDDLIRYVRYRTVQVDPRGLDLGWRLGMAAGFETLMGPLIREVASLAGTATPGSDPLLHQRTRLDTVMDLPWNVFAGGIPDEYKTLALLMNHLTPAEVRDPAQSPGGVPWTQTAFRDLMNFMDANFTPNMQPVMFFHGVASVEDANTILDALQHKVTPLLETSFERPIGWVFTSIEDPRLAQDAFMAWMREDIGSLQEMGFTDNISHEVNRPGGAFMGFKGGFGQEMVAFPRGHGVGLTKFRMSSWEMSLLCRSPTLIPGTRDGPRRIKMSVPPRNCWRHWWLFQRTTIRTRLSTAHFKIGPLCPDTCRHRAFLPRTGRSLMGPCRRTWPWKSVRANSPTVRLSCRYGRGTSWRRVLKIHR